MLWLESRGSSNRYLTQKNPTLFKNSCESSSNDCTIRTSNYCQDSIWIKSLATVLLEKNLQVKTEFWVMSQYLPVDHLSPSCTTTALIYGYFFCFLFLSCRILIHPRNFNSELQATLFAPQTIQLFIFKLFCGNLFVFPININKIR